MEIAKKIISGIFQKNYELGEIDDSIFIQIIKSGIEKAGSTDRINELYKHSVTKYVNIWIEDVKEGEYVEKKKRKKQKLF